MKVSDTLKRVLFVVGCSLLLSSCQEDVVQTQPDRGPVEVDVITLATEPVELHTELPGRTSAFRVAEVRPQVNGIITTRSFTEGAEVQEGELLYQIDPSTYQAAFDSAQAALAKAKALEASARLKAERYGTLLKTKAVSELDQVEYEAAWKQAVADVAAAEAALNSACINLEYTRITAPISGRIGKSMITEGALVTAQQSTPLAIIQQLDPLYVDVTQSSKELLRLKRDLAGGDLVPNETVTSNVVILLEDGTEYPQNATLAFSDVTVDQSTDSVTIRALVPNPDESLLPGLFVRARLSKGMKEDAVLIPSASLSRDRKGEAVVMLVNEKSEVESRKVEAVQNVGDKVLIGQGLVGGETLITAGIQKIKPGVVVKAVASLNSSGTNFLASTETRAVTAQSVE